MNSFRKFITLSAKEIEQEIMANVSSEAANSAIVEEQKLFFSSVLGGKNIRGALVKLGYLIADEKENKAVVKIAAAFEILHTAFLVHDDIIDKSVKRRGKPTLHKSLGGGHYGRSQAMCLGDFGFFLASQLIAESNFPGDLRTKALAFFCEMAMDTIMGEMFDIKLSLVDRKKRGFGEPRAAFAASYGEPREEDVLAIYTYKTARYTIVGPLVVGALLGRADKKLLDALQAFGEYVGMAFQIQDDILGTFGDEKLLGKSTVSDSEENKNTLLIVHALAKATPSQRKILSSFYGNGKINRSQHTQIKKIFEETGALAYSQKKAQDYGDKGRKKIPFITKDPYMQQLLNELVDLVIERVA